jgi:hypothetical protein
VHADVGSLPDEERAALAEELGYRSIGADLPSNVSLTDVISSLPKSVSLRAPLKLACAILSETVAHSSADVTSSLAAEVTPNVCTCIMERAERALLQCAGV